MVILLTANLRNAQDWLDGKTTMDYVDLNELVYTVFNIDQLKSGNMFNTSYGKKSENNVFEPLLSSLKSLTVKSLMV